MGKSMFNIVCYADYTVLMEKMKLTFGDFRDLQLNKACHIRNMEIVEEQN